MNNRNGMLSSVLSLGAIGAAIFGIARGLRSGTFQPFLQTIMSSMTGSAAQQIPQAAQGMMNGQATQGMMNGQATQKMAQPLQGMMNNQASQQQSSNQTPNNVK
ncbi:MULTISPECIES: hypothetical protein [Bacillaceae]|uniref:Uncharacterized protein n=1 Tax=Domibacillus aminovorans TaxID=29332 RepID=A0A177KQW9_9BACI|nr:MULTISPECIES: hypothetical protein [Bacillaceae]OAH55762.1 hypothetical protein AWH48_03545 [Domibacillus aminovorans]